MRAVVLRFSLVVGALGLLTACDDVLLGYDGSFTANCDRDPPLTYENFGERYMGKWCTGCHSSFQRPNQRSGAPEHINFNTYADILGWAEDIERTAVIDVTMPPGGGASEAEVGQLQEWLRCQVYQDAGRQAEGA